MGQQQLLFLVLGIVIVSIAVYIGIDLFDRSMQQKHVDLLVNHTVMVASEAVAWRSKETPFPGGGNSYNGLNPGGMSTILMAEQRMPGTLKLTVQSSEEITITAVSDDYPLLGVETRVVGTEIVETRIAYDGSIVLP